MTMTDFSLPATSTDLLWGPHDPAPFQIVNPDGQAPLLLVCDHASNAVPAALGQLGLNARELSWHIAWDIGAAEVTRQLARQLDAPAVLSGYSRLVVDCNRPPGDRTSIIEISDGIRIPGNCDLSNAEADARVNAAFWPYHRTITEMLAHRRRRYPTQPPALIAIHSFTPRMDGFQRPWHLGILWNRDPRLAETLLARLAADPDLCVGDNQPYSGRLVGFTMATHGGAAGLPHVELEIRQDLISDTAGCNHWAAVIGDALAAVLRHEMLFQIRHY